MDLACLMLVKIMKLIKVCIKAFPGCNKKGRSVDKVLGRKKWFMLESLKSTDASLYHGVLRQSVSSPITLYGDMGRMHFYTSFFESKAASLGRLSKTMERGSLHNKPWK